MNEQELIGDKSKIFQNLVRNQKWYLTVLILILFVSILSINLISGRPLLIGEESYYHLSQAISPSVETSQYYLLHLVQQFGEPAILIIPLLLSLGVLHLFLKLAEHMKISKKFTLIASTFTIISPFFLRSLASLSSYSLVIFLILLGFVLQNNNKLKHLALVPFALTTFIDGLSSLFLLIFLGMKWHYSDKKSLALKISIAVLGLFFLINLFFLQTPFMQGPFHSQNISDDLISDFGLDGNISFFLLLLGIIGLSLTWKRKKFNILYLLGGISIITYLINTNTAYLLSLVIVFLATITFINIFERKWTFVVAKRLSFMLLLLGLLFSSLSFLNTIPDMSPTADDFTALTWIKKSLVEEEVIFSSPENGYFIEYLGNRESFNNFHNFKDAKEETTDQILKNTDISDFITTMSKNGITVIYLNKNTQEHFPEKTGIYGFLDREHFKLLFNTATTEVWGFNEK